MKWFDRWLIRKFQTVWQHRDEMEKIVLDSSKPVSLGILAQEETWEDGLRITIKRMIGGSVVSFRVYDRRTDRHDTRNYIITDEQDFNTELGKIITMESMKQS
jgi:hypothetical protein